ncbi:MAG TPA: zf-HC2 domain-containing protein [Roseiarcus sp.]|nr:zf-HC2 domain-containing protein [Roseiarcus sp.]
MSDASDRDGAMREIEELLPWYAAGTLGADDKRRVEEALAREPYLRASLETIREDQGETIALNQALAAPRPGALDKILAVAEAEPRRPSFARRIVDATAQWAERLGRAASASPRALAFAVFAAALVVIGQGVAIVSLLPGGSLYSTASQPKSSASQGGFLLVGFAPTATAAEIADILQKKGATIVDGPRGGLYRLRVAEKPMTNEERDAALAAWRKEPIIRLALPANER